jgi:hypothetical protein
MGSIVKELQQEWLNPHVKTADLLRKALFVATKLGAKDFETWCSRELQGYAGETITPDYRMVTGEFVAWNPYQGWVPVYCENVKTAEVMSKRGCGQSIPELESLVEKSKDSFQMSYPKKIEADVLRSIDPLIRPRLHVEHSALIKIINSVRTIIFNWAVQLEKDGIIGDSLSFTEKEKQLAAAIPQTINNFYGPVGVSQIQQHSASASQIMIADLDLEKVKTFITAVQTSLDKLKLSPEATEELKAELQTIDSQVKSPKPKKAIITESLQTVRRILESVTGGLGLQLLKDYLGW